ncbi:MAG: ankyrin repeat domain-containing protein [Oscillospiraceae bacterium]|nr:ankyrin repeat domain-containing protein [Oscillospiraceae bacterium]
MEIKKIFKTTKKLILLFLLLNMLFVGYGKIQCNRMLDAIRNNDINKLERILKFADPDCVTDTVVKAVMSEELRYTPLGEACKKGDFEMVKLLVENGANVNYVPIKTEASPLGFAAKSDSVDNLKIVEFLLEKGADVNYSRNNHDHPAGMALHDRELRPNGMEILKALMEAGADPQKERILRAACNWRDEEAIRYLVEEWGYDASDPLYLCKYCYGGGEYCYETFEYFLERGANPYEKCIPNKYRGEECAIDNLKKYSPEWAEKLIALAAEYGFKE